MSPAAVMGRMQELMLAQWQELLRLRDEVLATSDCDAIHDLRVASRRFRTTLGLFEPWLPPKGTARLKKNTRKLTRVLGGLRNIDEARIFFREHRNDAETGERLDALLAEKRPTELARITRVLTELDHGRLDSLVQKAAKRLTKRAATPTPLPDYFAATCTALFKPINKMIPEAHSRKHREARHVLRIAIKKWRYFFEIAAPVMEQDYDAILGQLKEYQTILGRMNDLTEFGALCSRLKLTRRERNFIAATLQAEEKQLMRNLTELMVQKPLTNPLEITSQEHHTS